MIDYQVLKGLVTQITKEEGYLDEDVLTRVKIELRIAHDPTGVSPAMIVYSYVLKSLLSVIEKRHAEATKRKAYYNQGYRGFKSLHVDDKAFVPFLSYAYSMPNPCATRYFRKPYTRQKFALFNLHIYVRKIWAINTLQHEGPPLFFLRRFFKTVSKNFGHFCAKCALDLKVKCTF